MWKNNKLCQLKWYDGDIWRTDSPVITSRHNFMYKYVVLDEDGTQIAWEEGIDRIADLELIAQNSNSG